MAQGLTKGRSGDRSPVDGERLWNDIMALAAITDPERPYTRRSFSPRFLDGRQWLRKRFEEAGLRVSLDPAANLIGRLEGSDQSIGTIMIGSHSDTVPSGGRFDGPAGLIAALGVVRAMRAQGYHPRHAVEVVDFLAEEPSEFGLSCVGSRAMAGLLDAKMLGYVDAGGKRLEQAIEGVGGDTSRLDEAQRRDVAAFFELHIEQGVVLETKSIELGVVTAIVGITRVQIVFTGESDHAGTTPMDLRKDAAVAAAQLVAAISERAVGFAGKGSGHFVATVGVLEIKPNASNVVPGSARLIVDVRAEDQNMIDEFLVLIEAESARIAGRTRTLRSEFAILSAAPPTAFDPGLRDLLWRGATDLGFSTMPLASGAGHDAAFVARFAPSAMLFVPCRRGKSHAPEEWAEPEALLAGTATIFEAVRCFDEHHRKP
jgi:N-carbamoyl-L-amino-acid hydrolase